MIQVREKDLPEAALEGLVNRIAGLAGGKAVLTVNGALEVASRTGTGLHLPAEQAARWATQPACRPLGCSIHDDYETGAALALHPDYLVAGTVFATRSKPGKEGCGVQGLERLVAGAGGRPVFAIGGITPETVPAVLEAGAYGVAVCGAVLGAADPAHAALKFHEALRRVDPP
jgi:thiamine-phosphate diphosphorylase